MTTPSSGTRFRPRICFITYKHIAELADPIIAEYADRADIEVAEGAFEGALSIARERIRAGSVDVFVSSGANGAILRKHFETTPVAIIQLSGFDLMQALLKARERSTRVVIVMYGGNLLELDALTAILKVDIATSSWLQEGR